MSRRYLMALLCLGMVSAAAWFGNAGFEVKEPRESWTEVVAGVWRGPRLPAGYALVDGDRALLVDAPCSAEALKAQGVKKIDAVLLTHHHRDTCGAASVFLSAGIPVRAPKAAAEWLAPDKVQKYWQESIPLRDSRTAYFVVPVGLAGVDCTLEEGQTIDWHGWHLQVVATPGHSRDHLAFAARKGKDGPVWLFCGDALSAPGKLWTPYTTDWDHWTDAGLTPAAKALRKLAALKPAVLLPAHGPAITTAAVDALNRTAEAVENVAFLKSFERYSKDRLGNAPQYGFLAKEQVATSGEKPWTQVSQHLFLTGNTYVLTSKDNAYLVVDPWGQRSADQVVKLARERKLGQLEVVMFSHAHYDHYDGIYYLPDRDKFQVWTLAGVAGPIADPFRLRAPFLDARPVKIDRRLKDGNTANWREYHFRFHYLPGQSAFTMGVEVTIDGKTCYFTADNFFHQDQFSGTGGWMGLNRSYPLPYAASAQKVLDAAPDWVLAEHGGPFEFNAEDFRRRVQWGKVSAVAADAVCPSGNHRYDWDPNRVHVEPLLQKTRPGATLHAVVVAENVLDQPEKLTLVVEGRRVFADQTLALNIAPQETVTNALTVRLPEKMRPGRHIFAVRVADAKQADEVDAFFAVDVEP